jgi:hypothetical protein
MMRTISVRTTPIPPPQHRTRRNAATILAILSSLLFPAVARAQPDITILYVPDYQWESGCFGTATGNLMGFWDRNGLPDFYTGPTGAGLAPFDSFGANAGIFALWASRAGRDGRPTSKPGHVDDYHVNYESTAPDPHIAAGRTEHTPDCLGDFIGLNQRKWTNLDGECDGNIDGYCFNFWDKTGARRWNYTPEPANGLPVKDIQSGIRNWAASRGTTADSFSQLPDFSTEVTVPGQGFSFDDLRAEIDHGYPVLIFLQDWQTKSRPIGNMSRANPPIHGMLAIGYSFDPYGKPWVKAITSWAVGARDYPWKAISWESNLQLRGVIGFHPKPKIIAHEFQAGSITLRWHGPGATLYDESQWTQWPAHWYLVERSQSVNGPDWTAVAAPTADHEITFSDCCPATAFYRLRIVARPE